MSLRSLNRRLWHSRLGAFAVRAFIRLAQDHVFSARTTSLMQMDSLRLRARLSAPGEKLRSFSPKLHLGCGTRLVPGWMNVDVVGGDCTVDLACGSLPWEDATFDVIV